MTKTCLLTFGAALTILAAPTFGQAKADAVESLRGLESVFVIVEKLSPDVEQDGLHQDQIRTDVELRLRTAGIRVPKRAESLATPGNPYLLVNITTLKYGRVYAAFVEIQLHQTVALDRAKDIVVIGAGTWGSAALKIDDARFVSERIRQSVGDKVDEFINDYLSVNPRK
jgi:hypothetical protein